MTDSHDRLDGRTALVTGASRGIGAAIARQLAGVGARVAVLARSAESLHALVRELGNGATAIVCDVQQPDAMSTIASRLDSFSNGSVDIVVNNAGAFLVAPLQETSTGDFRQTLEVNLVAPFTIVRSLLPAMLQRRNGHVVTIGSVADRATFAGNAAYAASKYGLRALHEVLRAEVRGTGVRASLVSPGPVDTELWDSIDPDHQPGFTPRAQMLTAEAVAHAVRFVVTAPAELNVDELRLSRS